MLKRGGPGETHNLHILSNTENKKLINEIF